MFGRKKKTCLESRKGSHVFPVKWSNPIRISYQKEFGDFGKTSTEYKYVQTKVCKLCGIIYSNTCCYGNVIESGNVFRKKDGE